MDISIRPQDIGNFRSPAQAEAYDKAMKVKQEVEWAQRQAPEIAIEDQAALSKWTHLSLIDPKSDRVLSANSMDAHGELKAFVQNDSNRGAQLRIASQVAGCMAGGINGVLLVNRNVDCFTKIQVADDGKREYQRVSINNDSGLISYSEFKLPPAR